MNGPEHCIGFALPSLAHGGAQKVFVELFCYLQSQQRNVQLVCLDRQGELLERLDGVPGVEYFHHHRHRPGVWVRLGQLLRLRRWVRDKGVRTLYSTLTGMNLFVVLCFWFDRRVRIVLREANALENLNHPLKLLAMRLLYRRADRIICTSEYVRQQMLARGIGTARCLEFIPNPVDVERIHMLASRSIPAPLPPVWQDSKHTGKDGKQVAGKPLTRKRIVSVGRLVPAKGMDILITAMSSALIRQQASLIIIGDGPERERLQQLVRELELQDTVYLLGYQANPYPYMKAADLFVMASRWEGYVNTLVEAMALNLPIVATDCRSGPGDLLKSGLGMQLVPPGDADQLGRAIEAALEESAAPDYKALLEMHCLGAVAQRYLAEA